MNALQWTPSAAHAAVLHDLLAAASVRDGAPADWYTLPVHLRAQYPDATRAVVGYGSWYVEWLRKPSSFADVYLVVDDYARLYPHRSHAWWNH